VSPDALLPVALLAGFFGGGHCFGMCGPVVVLLEGQPTRGRAWQYRLLYNAGRGLFYMLLGAIAGAIGLVLTRVAGMDAGLRLLRWFAAGLVVALGLNLLFNLRLLGFLESGGAAIWRRISPLTRRLLPITSPPRALAVGFFWGALPCGLVYSSVALAATAGTAVAGAAVMLAFWIGTLPALLVAGASAGKLAQWSRRPALRRVAGVVMIVIGLLALALPMMTMKGGHTPGSTAVESHAAAYHRVAGR
jgi:sulfite exporter TauE/SafE